MGDGGRLVEAALSVSKPVLSLLVGNTLDAGPWGEWVMLREAVAGLSPLSAFQRA